MQQIKFYYVYRLLFNNIKDEIQNESYEISCDNAGQLKIQMPRTMLVLLSHLKIIHYPQAELWLKK